MTENGWPACGPDQLDRSNVPGTTLALPLQRGIPSKIMKAFAADINQYVESLNNSRGYADEGGWTPTNSVATSNHLGGTAMDLNWSDHPLGVKDGGWGGSDIIPGNQVPAVRELLAWYEGMIFWGNDWSSPIDSMHFQMGYDTFNNQAKCNDFIRRKIRADGFSAFRRGAPAGGTASAPVPTGRAVDANTELTKLFASRSPLRTNDVPFETLAGFVLAIDRMEHLRLEVDAARVGVPGSIALLRKLAAGDPDHAGTWLWYPDAKGNRQKDTWAIEYAKAVLAEIDSRPDV